MRVPRTAAARRRVCGMTLVELMVGLAVGLFVSLIAISVFVSTRTLNVVNSASARMGENARVAMEALQDDLRSAGFRGCHDSAAAPPGSTLRPGPADTLGFLPAGDVGLLGYRGTGTGGGASFAPALATALAALAVPPADDSDVVSLRVPVDNLGYGVTQSMATPADAPQLGTAGPGASSTLQTGDIVLISDCKTADIFQITAPPADVAAGTLRHIVDSVSNPGNSTANLTRRYRDEATVYRLQTRHYYVAPSVLQPGVRALWRFAVPCPECATNPQELAAGVERLNIAWGIDTDAVPDRVLNRYVAPAGVAVWDNVIAARLQMLVATAQNGVTQSTAASVAFAGAVFTPPAGDRRLRTVLTEVVTLRNHAP